ncbi:MAG: hypothetical protein KDD67_14545 [Ignavibacteriae bacterium]|nr:hypothetical protein [Ignavibacteriota bacterium]MCB9215172.1 hypothetical protein [Ignavibacteria bacterium]
MPDEEKKQPDLAEKVKNWTAALREAVIALLFLFLLLFPSCVTQRLADAGFTKGDFAGLHWEKQLLEMTEQTGEAQQHVQQVEESIDSIRQSLVTIGNDAQSPEVKAQVDQLTIQLDSSLQSVRSVDRDLKASLRTQENLLQTAPVNSFSSKSSHWGIVISADRDVNAAEHEVERAKKASDKEISVYQKDQLFLTVVEFSSREEALTDLPSIKARIQDGAYLVDMERWCPKPEEGERDGWFVCGK